MSVGEHMGTTETKPEQTPEEVVKTYRNSSEEHFRRRMVPLGVIVLFGLADHFIPRGVPTTIEEVAIWGYLAGFVRQSYLGVRDMERADKAERLVRSANTVSPRRSL